MSVIDSSSTDWTKEEEEIALAVLAKMRLYAQKGKPLPPRAFELDAERKKNVSTEGVFCNEHGEIYLIKRPSWEENPSEPYPDMWHSPGVTHGPFETNEEALKRLIGRELGNVVVIDRPEIILREGYDPPRARYELLIMPMLISGQPDATSKGRFFKVDEIPWDQLVPSHRETILPEAIRVAKRWRWVA